MRTGRILFGLAMLTVCSAGSALEGQQGLWVGPGLLMSPQMERGQPVSPFFEGWWKNPDGTYTLSFGYYNRNTEEAIEIPLGPNNFIEPAQYNGKQPTDFPTHADYSIKGREWGAFTVVVPADFVGEGKDVVWSLTSKGVTHTVPGRVGRPDYQIQGLDQPMGRGSFAPRLRLDPSGPDAVGQAGVTSGTTRNARVGVPLDLTVWASDNFAAGRRDSVAVTLTWFKHQGPVNAPVTFEPAEVQAPVTGGNATTRATFTQPGSYLVRVRVDNWTAGDSDDQRLCCWTNGYVRVNVTP